MSDTDEDFLWSGLACAPEDYKSNVFALAGCRRHCAIMNFWLLDVLESALDSRHDFTLGRRARIVTALCAEFRDRWKVCRYRFLCVRVTRLVCVRQARAAPSNLAYVTCLAAPELPGVPCRSLFPRKPELSILYFHSEVVGSTGCTDRNLSTAFGLCVPLRYHVSRTGRGAVSQRQDSQTEYGSMLLGVVLVRIFVIFLTWAFSDVTSLRRPSLAIVVLRHQGVMVEPTRFRDGERRFSGSLADMKL